MRCLCHTLYISDISTKYLWYKKATKAELITFIEELSKKQKNFEIWFSNFTPKKSFLDTIQYKDENNNIQATLDRKSTNDRSYLQVKLEHARFLKNSIPYRQA